MTTVVVLFNLKPGTGVAEYEAWARSRDLPAVNALDSVDRFDVLRATGLLIGEGLPPYQYIEVIRVRDLAAFGREVAAAEVQAVAAEFAAFADSPVFILTEAL